ncbi:MAG: hypothetical protein PHO87_04475 [Acholeplasmataceae bacterium]|nr:hypothetical protein [Acholeplasmataceae bacterium]
MISKLTDAIGNVHVYIDDVEISGILITNGIPIPDINTKTATLIYYIVPKDSGQLIVDQAIYGKKIHEYKIILAEDQTWTYQGIISEYLIDTQDIAQISVDIKLCGMFMYTRNQEVGKLEIKKYFIPHVEELKRCV